jgi:hypothetical protein
MATITESLADALTGGKLSRLQETGHQTATELALVKELTGGKLSRLQETGHQTATELALVKESLQRLEQMLHAPEWRIMIMDAQQEFSRQGMRDIVELARLMRLKNPIIQRGCEIQRLYVWAQGATISARDHRINETIQRFMDDERNRDELTTHQARGERETELQESGNLFFRFFIDPQNGRIRLRTIDPNEIDDIICNPDDKKEPWFYRRVWTEKRLDGSTESHTEYYPDFRFHPRQQSGFQAQLRSRDGSSGSIDWETPVYHVAVNKLGRWGICEFYAANDWARAYKSFLGQLAAVWSSLARWAAKLSGVKGGRGIAAARQALASQGNPDSPPLTGSLAIVPEGQDLQPFRTAGATMSADDGRRLLLMAIMPFGFPETFYADASVGTLATAKSLDRVTELKILDRQTLWKSVHEAIFDFVLFHAVNAPAGPLRGLARVVREPDGDEWSYRLQWNEDIDPTVLIEFPSIIEHDVQAAVGAVIDAVTLKGQPPAGTMPAEVATRRLLTELGFGDVDEIMEIWRDEQEQMAINGEPDGASVAEAIRDYQAIMTSVNELLAEVEVETEANGHPV